MRILSLFAPVLVLLASSTEQTPDASVSNACTPRKAKPCLSESEAFDLHLQFLDTLEIDLRAFDSRGSSYSCYQGSCAWTFFYNGYPPAPGFHFHIRVSDPSREVEYVGGA